MAVGLPEATTVPLVKSFPVMLITAPLLIASCVSMMFAWSVSVDPEVKFRIIQAKVLPVAVRWPAELTWR